MMNIQFHRKSLELIGDQPRFGETTYRDLPASVAEWFSLVNGLELLMKYSHEDVPVPPSEFKSYKHNGKEFVVFMYENQGVAWWAYEKCNNDDPPVYINFDPLLDNWLFETKSFSIFVYAWLFDHFHWSEENLFIIDSGKSIDDTILKFLHREFVQEPTSFDWDNRTVYRFSHDDQKITIKNGAAKSVWTFAADTPESLNSVHEKLRHFLDPNAGF